MAASKRAADNYEMLVEETIASCDGNLRSAVRALLIANEHLEAEVSQLRDFARASAQLDGARQNYLH